MRRIASAALAVIALGCAPEAPPLAFRVRAAPPDDPLRGADAIVVALEREGVVVAGTEQRFASDTTALELASLPFGERLAIRVETRLGELVLARGRSFPFDYPSADRAPVGDPDVWLGTLGRFARPLSEVPTGAPRAIAATSDGALIASATELLAYRAHDARGAAALETLGRIPAELADAVWASMGDRLLAAGTTSPGLSVLAPDGARTDVPLDRGARAIGVLAADGDVLAWLEDGALVRIDLRPGAAALVTPLTAVPAPAPASRPQIVAVRARVRDRDVTRALLLDDERAIVVDPDGVEAPSIVALAASRGGRVAAAVGSGLVLVAGGRDSSGTVSDEVALWVVRPEHVPALELVSPAPPPLFVARAGAAVASFGPSLVLIAGGTGPAGEPLASAELVDVSAFPGEVAATGTLPFADAAPVAAYLADRTVLVAGERGLALYFPPRE